MIVRGGVLVLVLSAGLGAGGTAALELSAEQRETEEILRQLVELETVATRPDQIRAAAQAMALRLEQAGFPPADLALVSPEGEGAEAVSLVARYRGTGRAEPLLLMAHLDVVPADPHGWSFPPFRFGKDERWYYGRGTADNKAGVATLVATFAQLRRAGFRPSRDLIAVLTADEETEGAHIDWLVRERRDLVDAALALNTDAGGGRLDANGEPQLFAVQTSEKVYQTFRISTENAGGHSSVPRPDNAIYRLAAGLTRLAGHRFPVRWNETTKAGLRELARFERGELADEMLEAASGDREAAERVAERSPMLNAWLRTTCVATQLEGGHAENALPRAARATINCRIFPGVPVERVEAELHRALEDAEIRIERIGEARPSPPSPLADAVLEPVRDLVAELWPGAAVVPTMSTGATDGLFVRGQGIPVYGISAIFSEPDQIRAHGLDERVGIEELHRAVEFWRRLLVRLASDPR